jgi:NAD(P)-dependent dehydrogenase (short-subunit alcohol dehydrogenase family)
MTVNAKSIFLNTKYVVPYMKRSGGGSIVNISSIYGITSAPNAATYSATKGAIRSMTKADALTYAECKIRVNSIHPGHIWTPLLENFANTLPGGPKSFKENLCKQYPLGHLGDPEDVAYGALYLASDESKFITGSELVIDGGYLAR